METTSGAETREFGSAPVAAMLPCAARSAMVITDIAAQLRNT